MGETIFTQKRKYSSIVKNNFFKNSKNKINGIIFCENEEKIDFLIKGSEILGINLLIITEKFDNNNFGEQENINFSKKENLDIISGFDFGIFDIDMEVKEFIKNGVVPIISDNISIYGILKEFNPLKNEGNSFIYIQDNKWSLYYAVIRYIENLKFPYDNRNLIKNLCEL